MRREYRVVGRFAQGWLPLLGAESLRLAAAWRYWRWARTHDTTARVERRLLGAWRRV